MFAFLVLQVVESQGAVKVLGRLFDESFQEFKQFRQIFVDGIGIYEAIIALLGS